MGVIGGTARLYFALKYREDFNREKLWERCQEDGTVITVSIHNNTNYDLSYEGGTSFMIHEPPDPIKPGTRGAFTRGHRSPMSSLKGSVSFVLGRGELDVPIEIRFNLNDDERLVQVENGRALGTGWEGQSKVAGYLGDRIELYGGFAKGHWVDFTIEDKASGRKRAELPRQRLVKGDRDDFQFAIGRKEMHADDAWNQIYHEGDGKPWYDEARDEFEYCYRWEPYDWWTDPPESEINAWYDRRDMLLNAMETERRLEDERFKASGGPDEVLREKSKALDTWRKDYAKAREEEWRAERKQGIANVMLEHILPPEQRPPPPMTPLAAMASLILGHTEGKA